jgi:hypothetical protein
MKKDNLSPYPSNPGFIVGVTFILTDLAGLTYFFHEKVFGCERGTGITTDSVTTVTIM